LTKGLVLRARLADPDRQWGMRVKEWLRALDLSSVAITATIDAEGRLGPVASLWPKLLVAARAAADLGLLRLVIVAAEQPDVPKELLEASAMPLRVVQADSLWAAVELAWKYAPAGLDRLKALAHLDDDAFEREVARLSPAAGARSRVFRLIHSLDPQEFPATAPGLQHLHAGLHPERLEQMSA